MFIHSYQEALREWQILIKGRWEQEELNKCRLVETRLHARLHKESECCALCNSAVVTQAHIFPKSKGGSRSFWNLITLCNSCNRGIDSQIMLKHRSIESKYDPNSLLAESAQRYSRGEATCAAKLAKIAALINLVALKPSDFVLSTSVVVKCLRASIHYEELQWFLGLLNLSIDKGGQFLDRFTLKYAAAQILAHYINIGALKVASQHQLSDLLAEDPISDREWRLRLKAL